MQSDKIIEIVIAALISVFAKTLLEKLYAFTSKKIADNKLKIRLFLKRFLVFNLRYTLIVFHLINLFISTREVTKTFVFLTVFLFSVLLINIALDTLGEIIKIMKGHLNITGKLIEKDSILKDSM